MNRRNAASFLACLLTPFALLGIGFAILLIYSFFFSPPAQPVWEGENFGNTDQMFPFFLPSLFIYVLLGLIFWLGLILCAVFSVDDSVSKMILRLHFWFNLLATGYWIAWTVHFSSPHSAQNPGYLWMEVLPLFVTVPVFLFSGVHLFRRTKSS